MAPRSTVCDRTIRQDEADGLVLPNIADLVITRTPDALLFHGGAQGSIALSSIHPEHIDHFWSVITSWLHLALGDAFDTTQVMKAEAPPTEGPHRLYPLFIQ